MPASSAISRWTISAGSAAAGGGGCLEAYASGPQIAARARERIAAGGESSLADLAEVTSSDVAEAAAAGDAVASEVWDETTAMLGSAVANILDVFNPELVVLGGGVTRAGDQLLVPVREAALRQAMAPARERGGHRPRRARRGPRRRERGDGRLRAPAARGA